MQSYDQVFKPVGEENYQQPKSKANECENIGEADSDGEGTHISETQPVEESDCDVNTQPATVNQYAQRVVSENDGTPVRVDSGMRSNALSLGSITRTTIAAAQNSGLNARRLGANTNGFE